jgi:hypothetical protein
MTNNSKQAVFVDSEVSIQILGVIDQARQHIVIVSPYLDMWQHAQNAIGRAVKRGVDVRIFLRDDQDRPPLEQIQWLVNNGVKVFAVQRLHAKIYMNEQTVLLSSMNFTESSALNSLEIAYIVRDNEQSQRIRGYVRNDITSSAVQVPSASDATSLTQHAQPVGHPPINVQLGFCIRCGQPRAFDPNRPLCDDCYDSWARYANEDYQEKFCHSCGHPAEVSYARPLCGPCYARQR